MASRKLNSVVRHVRRVLDPGEGDAVSDAELLDRFARSREQAAFELLVWRHRHMVLGVCRRVLGDVHEADDAFQATFLVLARKAGSIGRGQALGSWLYRVAFRAALKARTRLAKRAAYERHDLDLAAFPSLAEPGHALERRELSEALDQEVVRLPERLRGPVILCYLQGKSYVQAAQRLGVPVGTISTRLSRARSLLHTRLSRRGLDVSSAALAAFLCAQAALAAPTALVDTTLAALLLTGGSANGLGAVPAGIASLAKEVLHTMFLNKLKVVGALAFTVCLAAAAVATGVAALSGAADAGRQAAQKKEARPGLIWKLRTTLEGHTAPVACLAVSRDGKLLASASDDSTVKIWDRASGKELATVKETDGGGMRGVTFSPDGKTIATAGGDKVVRIFETASGAQLHKLVGHTAATYSVLFTPDGKTLVSGAGSANYPDKGQEGFGEICFWDTAAGKQRCNVRSHTWPVAHLAFTADGKTLITGGYDNCFKVWDYQEDQLPKERLSVDVGKSQGIYAMALSPSGASLVVACDGTVKSYDVATGNEGDALEKSAYRDGWLWQGIAISPDGKIIAAASPIQEWENKDKKFVVQRRSTVMLWDTATGKLRDRLSVDECVTKLTFAPDGKTLIGGCRGKMREASRVRQLTDIEEEKRGPVLLWDLEPAKPAPKASSPRRKRTQDQGEGVARQYSAACSGRSPRSRTNQPSQAGAQRLARMLA